MLKTSWSISCFSQAALWGFRASQNIIITSTILSAWYSSTFKQTENAALWKMLQLSPETHEEKMHRLKFHRNLISGLNHCPDLIINMPGTTDALRLRGSAPMRLIWNILQIHFTVFVRQKERASIIHSKISRLNYFASAYLLSPFKYQMKPICTECRELATEAIKRNCVFLSSVASVWKVGRACTRDAIIRTKDGKTESRFRLRDHAGGTWHQARWQRLNRRRQRARRFRTP